MLDYNLELTHFLMDPARHNLIKLPKVVRMSPGSGYTIAGGKDHWENIRKNRKKPQRVIEWAPPYPADRATAPRTGADPSNPTHVPNRSKLKDVPNAAELAAKPRPGWSNREWGAVRRHMKGRQKRRIDNENKHGIGTDREVLKFINLDKQNHLRVPGLVRLHVSRPIPGITDSYLMTMANARSGLRRVFMGSSLVDVQDESHGRCKILRGGGGAYWNRCTGTSLSKRQRAPESAWSLGVRTP